MKKSGTRASSRISLSRVHNLTSRWWTKPRFHPFVDGWLAFVSSISYPFSLDFCVALWRPVRVRRFLLRCLCVVTSTRAGSEGQGERRSAARKRRWRHRCAMEPERSSFSCMPKKIFSSTAPSICRYVYGFGPSPVLFAAHFSRNVSLFCGVSGVAGCIWMFGGLWEVFFFLLLVRFDSGVLAKHMAPSFFSPGPPSRLNSGMHAWFFVGTYVWVWRVCEWESLQCYRL